VVSEDLGDRAGRHAVAESQEFTSDSLVAPPRIAGRQAHDQPYHLVGEWRAAFGGVVESPVPSDHAAVPAQQRLGPHQEHLPAVPGQQPRKEGQQCSVLGLQARPGVRTAENLQLMAEHQDLDLLWTLGGGTARGSRANTRRKARYANDDKDNTPASSRASERAGYRVTRREPASHRPDRLVVRHRDPGVAEAIGACRSVPIRLIFLPSCLPRPCGAAVQTG
jgi:hypothetical protein